MYPLQILQHAFLDFDFAPILSYSVDYIEYNCAIYTRLAKSKQYGQVKGHKPVKSNAIRIVDCPKQPGIKPK